MSCVRAFAVQSFGWTYLPAGAKPLRVKFVEGQLWMWALVDPSSSLVARHIIVCGDYEFVREDVAYIGTADREIGSSVHVFDKGEV